MKEDNHNRIYTAEDIRKYLDGQLSDPEMQTMEKAALDDPFLADAIEGFEESRKHGVSFESGVEDLQKRLATRIHQRKRKKGIIFQLSAWQAAASLLFLVGSAVFILIYINNKTHSIQIAVSTNKDSSAVKNTAPPRVREPDSPLTQLTTTQPRQTAPEKSLAKRNHDMVFDKKESPSSMNEAEVKKEKQAVPTEASHSNELTDTVSLSRKSSGLQTQDATNKNTLTESAADSRKETFGEPSVRSLGRLSGDYIQGVVVNDMGKPISHAQISVQGFKRRVYTDTAGFFRLYMKNPRLAALIFIQPAGYDPVSTELKPDSTVTHTIQMQPSSPVLSEVVALEYKKTSNITGWDAFTNYINNNKKIDPADSLLKGEEVISFLLHKDGTLTAFKFDHSVSLAHDSAIIQLIRTAPPLKLENGKKQRCTITIVFK